MNDLIITTLDELEIIIEKGIETFYEVGNALKRIKDERLWSSNYESFEDYCQKRWGFKISNAYHLMSSAEVANNLPSLPTKASHVIPLKTLTPENQCLAWQEATITGNEVTAKHVESIALKYRLSELLGDDHWAVKLVNNGVMTSSYVWQVYKILEKLPSYYQTSVETLRQLPSSNVLQALRRLEYSYKSEVLDILRSGYLDAGKYTISLSDLTIRDLDRWESKLRYETVAIKQVEASIKQKNGLPIFDGENIFDIDGDLVYLFPDNYVKENQLVNILQQHSYNIFMVIAYRNNPVINFDSSNKIRLQSVNGVKPQFIMDLVKQL